MLVQYRQDAIISEGWGKNEEKSDDIEIYYNVCNLNVSILRPAYAFVIDSSKQEYVIYILQQGQPDTIIQNVYDPQMLNRYAFEKNNPYKNTDPTGHLVIPGDLIVLSVITMGVYLSGQCAMAIANKQLEEAKESGDKKRIRNANLNFYFVAFTAPLSLVFPESKLIEAYDFISNTRTGKTMVVDLVNDLMGNDYSDASSPEKILYQDESVIIKSPPRDKNGKTEMDRLIEQNQQANKEKEAQGMYFKGYDSNGKAIYGSK
ncbi:MAG: hypothetical protein ACP5NV_04330 [Candidatus Woesearchaeota archaeon]